MAYRPQEKEKAKETKTKKEKDKERQRDPQLRHRPGEHRANEARHRTVEARWGRETPERFGRVERAATGDDSLHGGKGTKEGNS
mgnify:CR=1 FL=1